MDESLELTWSMAHGIRHGIEESVPKIWGNELENEGAAWIETKWLLPMLSLMTTPTPASATVGSRKPCPGVTYL
jgi:hypothetical protein